MIFNSQKELSNVKIIHPNIKGELVADEVVKVVSDFINKYKICPKIINIQTLLLKDVPSWDKMSEVKRIYNFVRDNVRYTPGAYGVQQTQLPLRTLKRRAGYCPDFSALLGALLASAGFEVQLVLISQKQNKKFHHIFPQVRVNSNWISVDATKPNYELGQEYPNQTNRKIFKINHSIKPVNNIKRQVITGEYKMKGSDYIIVGYEVDTIWAGTLNGEDIFVNNYEKQLLEGCYPEGVAGFLDSIIKPISNVVKPIVSKVSKKAAGMAKSLKNITKKAVDMAKKIPGVSTVINELPVVKAYNIATKYGLPFAKNLLQGNFSGAFTQASNIAKEIVPDFGIKPLKQLKENILSPEMLKTAASAGLQTFGVPMPVSQAIFSMGQQPQQAMQQMPQQAMQQMPQQLMQQYMPQEMQQYMPQQMQQFNPYQQLMPQSFNPYSYLMQGADDPDEFDPRDFIMCGWIDNDDIQDLINYENNLYGRDEMAGIGFNFKLAQKYVPATAKGQKLEAKAPKKYTVPQAVPLPIVKIPKIAQQMLAKKAVTPQKLIAQPSLFKNLPAISPLIKTAQSAGKAVAKQVVPSKTQTSLAKAIVEKVKKTTIPKTKVEVGLLKAKTENLNKQLKSHIIKNRQISKKISDIKKIAQEGIKRKEKEKVIKLNQELVKANREKAQLIMDRERLINEGKINQNRVSILAKQALSNADKANQMKDMFLADKDNADKLNFIRNLGISAVKDPEVINQLYRVMKDVQTKEAETMNLQDQLGIKTKKLQKITKEV